MQCLPIPSRSYETLPEDSSLEIRARWPVWLLLLSGLLAFSPLIEGGTTHQAVMTIRLLILLLLSLSVTQAIRTGTLPIPPLHVGLPVLAYLSIAALSTWRSPYTNQSVQWLIILLGYAALLYLLVSFLDQWNHVAKLLALVVGMGLLEAGWTLVQGAWFGVVRPSGSFFNPNFLAGYLAVSWTIVLSWAVYRKVRWAGAFPLDRWRRARPLWVRLSIVMAVLAVLLAALIWTGSRGGFLAMLTGTIVVVGLRFGRRWAAGLLLVLLALGVLIPNPLRDRLWTEHAVNPVTYARWQLWQSSIHEMATRPLGIGLGLYQYVYPRRAVPIEGQITRYGKVAQTTHNEYLQMGVELGIAGLLIFCWGTFGVAREATLAFRQRLTRWQRGTTAGLIAAVAGILIHAIVDSNLHEPAIAIMLTLCVAMLLSIRRLSTKPVEPSPSIPIRSKVLWTGVWVLVIAGLIAMVVKVGLAWMAYESGSRALAQQNFSGAVADYGRAVALDPGKALYHSSMAAAYFQVFQQAGDEAAAQTAVAELQTAIRLNPLDGRLPGLLGHVYGTLASADPRGHRQMEWLRSALSSYERAQELEPFSPFHRLEQGRIHLALGHREQAETAVQQAIEMEPNFLPGREWLARLYLASGQIDAADHEYREILERQQRYVDWIKDPLEARFLKADASALQAALDRKRART
jgi:putative inorganic carbon (HCO3(-)) transporter